MSDSAVAKKLATILGTTVPIGVVNLIVREIENAYSVGVLEEREACAKICDKNAKNSSHPMNFAENCAAAIRAR